jgi:hypothetical protein
MGPYLDRLAQRQEDPAKWEAERNARSRATALASIAKIQQAPEGTLIVNGKPPEYREMVLQNLIDQMSPAQLAKFNELQGVDDEPEADAPLSRMTARLLNLRDQLLAENEPISIRGRRLVVRIIEDILSDRDPQWPPS